MTFEGPREFRTVIGYRPMGRSLSSGYRTALSRGVVRPLFLVELTIGADIMRLHDDVGDIEWNGHTWEGVGDLGQVGNIAESSDLSAPGVALTLAAVKRAGLDFSEVAQGSDYFERPVKIYLAMRHVISGAILDDPVEVHRGFIDSMPMAGAAESAVITARVESHLIEWDRACNFLNTDATQRALFPGDKGSENVERQADLNLRWGPE